MVFTISGGRKISAECRQGFRCANLDKHHYIFLIQQVISTGEQTPGVVMGKCLFQGSTAEYWHNICSILSSVRGSFTIYSETQNQGAGLQHQFNKASPVPTITRILIKDEYWFAAASFKR
jgi:hypothetical protein